MELDKKLSIIWNLTRLCSWNCRFCCVNAKYQGSLKQVNCAKNVNYKYSNELNYRDKVKIIDQLTPGRFRIDFSGGELLIDPLNIDLILYASQKLGPDSVGMSISGMFLTDELIEKLVGKVNDIELTLDYLPYKPYELRPVGYHEYAAHAVTRLVNSGFRVGVQTVITRENIQKKKIYTLYNWLEENKVSEWSLLRFFPSGRAKKFVNCAPSFDEYCDIVDYIKQITWNAKTLKVHFQYLLPNHDQYTINCRAVKKSIGILPDGTVISCFWALNENMAPTDNEFILGKLPEENIESLLSGSKAGYWKLNDHKCKIFDHETMNERKMINL